MWISRKTYDALKVSKVTHDLKEQINSIHMSGYNHGANVERWQERLNKAATIIREKNALIEKLMEMVPPEDINKLTIYLYKHNFYNRNDPIL